MAIKTVFGDRRRQAAGQDFIDRYNRGAPWNGYTDQEVLDRYRAVAARISPMDFEEAARAAMARFSPQDCELFGRYLQQKAEWQGLRIADLDGNAAEDNAQHAEILGHVLARFHCRQDGRLEQLLGIGGGSFDSLLAKGALAGIVAAATNNGRDGL
jgi:hypothetical protein